MGIEKPSWGSLNKLGIAYILVFPALSYIFGYKTIVRPVMIHAESGQLRKNNLKKLEVGGDICEVLAK